MNPTEFIRKNITDRLLAENFTLSVAQSAANEGVKYYLKATGATVRGGLFNDCFKHAEAWAKKLSKIDKPLKQKKSPPDGGSASRKENNLVFEFWI